MTRETQGPSQDDIERALKKALDKTIRELSEQIVDGLSERAIVHRFAVALERDGVFAGWHIDCEYNRDGHDPKRLARMSSAPQPCSDDCRLVLPDLIVHRRGTTDNLLVVEVKTKRDAKGEREDVKKLRRFRAHLHYKHAYFVSFTEGGCVKRVDVKVMDAGAI